MHARPAVCGWIVTCSVAWLVCGTGAAALLQAAEPSQPDTASGNAVAAIERLKKCGVEFTETKGIVTGAAVKDTGPISDDDFAALGTIATLKNISISGDKLNDKTLGLLTGLAALEDFSSNMAQFSDDGLKQFAAFPNLRQIKFFHTSLKSKTFTGAGFAALASMKNLRKLTVAGCPFNDEGMAAVGKLTQLDGFRTWHTYQTEAGNASLRSLTNLKSLYLGQRLRKWNGKPDPWSLSDATLDVIATIPSLESLTLNEAEFTVAALAKLKSLPNLKLLDLSRIELSDEQLAELKKSLPGVDVKFQPLNDEDRKRLTAILKQ